MKTLTLTLTLAAALLQGCATVAVDRARDLSSAAIRYADATVAVIDLAIDSAIDANSENRFDTAPKMPVATEKERLARADLLEEHDVGLVKTVSLYTSLKNSVNTTKAYFIALQDLANGSQAEATGEAVKSVAQRVNGINQVLANNEKTPKLNDATINALEGLAKQVAAQVHGTIVANALKHDAPIIGRAFALQQQVLAEAAKDIKRDLKNANARFFVARVRGPFEKGVLGPSWVDDRRAYLKVRALGETDTTLNAAQAAAAQMHTVWQRILSGAFSAGEITAVLKDTDDLLSAVNLLKNARKSN